MQNECKRPNLCPLKCSKNDLDFNTNYHEYLIIIVTFQNTDVKSDVSSYEYFTKFKKNYFIKY